MFQQFIGNDVVKIQLSVSIQAAKMSNRALGHILFAGNAGCGKTTMARLVAKEMQVPILEIAPEGLNSAETVRNILIRLPDDGYDNKGNKVGKIQPAVIFCDEIHQMPLKGQETFGIAMEQRIIKSILKVGAQKRAIKEWVPEFTLIGATTELGLLSKPFRDKFKLSFDFKPYSLSEMVQIVLFHAQNYQVIIDYEAVTEIAQRSRGVPRFAVKYLEGARDLMLVSGKSMVSKEITDLVFDRLSINKDGLYEKELTLLKTLKEYGKVGLEMLSVLLNESQKTIVEEYEPFLIRMGLMGRSSSGRFITDKGLDYLGHIGDNIKIGRILEWEK